MTYLFTFIAGAFFFGAVFGIVTDNASIVFSQLFAMGAALFMAKLHYKSSTEKP